MFTRESKASPAAMTVLQQAAKNGNTSAVPLQEPVATSQALPPAAAPAGAVTIPLSKPLITHQGTKQELVLRAPTFSDYIEIGDIDTPVITGAADGDPGQEVSVIVKTNYAAIMKWAAALTGHDQIVLSQLAPDDAGTLMQRVRLALKPFQKGNSPATPTT